MLNRTLADVRKRITRAGSKGLNENNTKATLIEPVLRALGWDVEDVEEVAREHRGKSRDRPVDYALLVLREPRLFVEAKALGESLADSRCANQIMGYASVAGVEWIVITNGDEYRIYNSHATVRIEEKLLRSVRVSDESSDAGEILGLLSKDQLKTNQIDALWKAHFVDRKVKGALERYFSADHDMALVNHVRAIAKDLSPEDIRGSMRRCKWTLDFPLSPGDLVTGKSTKRSSKPSRNSELSHEVTLLDLIQAGLIKAPLKIARRYKGRDLEARVLADGMVECAGKTFASLSQAGSAARATVTGLRPDGRMRATNGWTFWQYRGPDGKPVEIDRIRQQFVSARKKSPEGSAAKTG